ncbi:DUF302 domain-containing protein [Pseudomonas sp. Pseusp122]|uniref:DUF302 domain-containing protein n=1 Tax=unclassified Pseudomonas TaxID=196821 RepID=UPI0039A5C3D5
MQVNEQTFQGVRVRLTSAKPYAEALTSLLDDIGDVPIDLDQILKSQQSWDDCREYFNQVAGPSGFMLFGMLDHGAWMDKAGSFRRSIRIILGNPLIALTMLKHDLRAGLFAPVELLLIEEEGDRSSLTYLKPSSLMVVEENPPLLAAATVLDRKLEALALKVAKS